MIPNILYISMDSWKSRAENSNISTYPRVVYGYAYDISNFVIAIIHDRPLSSVNSSESIIYGLSNIVSAK